MVKKRWTHQAHLVVGYWYLSRLPVHDAICYLRSGIITLNESMGGVNSPAEGYHETLTLFWVKVIAYFHTHKQPSRPNSFFSNCQSFLESPLANVTLPFQFYSRDHLFSTKARAVWVDPDIKPIDFASIWSH